MRFHREQYLPDGDRQGHLFSMPLDMIFSRVPMLDHDIDMVTLDTIEDIVITDDLFDHPVGQPSLERLTLRLRESFKILVCSTN